MKKNAVGRILYQKEPVKRRISTLHIPARLLCLLLALLIWLVVTDLQKNPESDANEGTLPYSDTAL